MTAKIFQFYLVPNYCVVSDRPILTLFFIKLRTYPLFYNKNHGTTPMLAALKCL